MLAPILILAVGNPSRGDDALAPLLLEWLHNAGTDAAGDVELLTDFQLQVEHALDVQGRQAVLFVDAARPGIVQGARIDPVQAAAVVPPASHALDASSVLRVALQLHGSTPPSWILAMEGQSFELGEALSGPAQKNLRLAQTLVQDWLGCRLSAPLARPLQPALHSEAPCAAAPPIRRTAVQARES